MPFNSLYFVVFALVVLLVHHVVLHDWSAGKRFLLAASWFFYAAWSASFLLLLIGTTWLDFQLARLIHRARWTPGDAAHAPGRARMLLAVSLVVNLGLLASLKYGRFLWGSLDALVPLPPAPSFLPLVVPLGISFYTFHSASYIIDTYRGVRPPTDRFGDFALYVAFFP